MAGYYQRELPTVTRATNIDLGSDSMLKAGGMIANALGSWKEKELADAKRAEDQKRYETEIGFKQRQEQRLVDELGREQATREAVLANLSPDRFKEAKLGEIDTAIAQGMANLSPQERAEAEAQVKANWDRVGSGNYALGLARDSTLADPSKVLSAQSDRLKIALSDPNSAEFKAAQQAEWDSAKRKMDYSHGQAVSLQNLKNKEEQDSYRNALGMLDVSTSKTVDLGDNSSEIDAINRQNARIGDLQARYGDAYVQAYNSNPNASAEAVDEIARRAVGISSEGNIGSLYPMEKVPEYVKEIKQVPKTEQEYAKDVMARASQGKLTAGGVQVAENLIKSYKGAIEANKEKKTKEAIVQDYKSLIDNLGGDSSKVTTEDGAKAQLKAIEAKIKANKGNTEKGNGLGVETVKAVESTGLDAGDFEAVRQKAVTRKIGDKELAALILAGNKPGSWGATLSSTQRDNILKYLDDYPTK